MNALLSSVVLTLLLSAVRRGGLRSRGAWFSERSPSAERETSGSETPRVSHDGFRALFAPLKRASWKRRLLPAIVIFHLISRIRLPRVVRYNPIYRTLFGPNLFGPRLPALQRSLAGPSTLLRAAVPLTFKLVRLPLRAFGWKTALLVYLAVVFLSRRRRAATRRAFGRGAVRLSTLLAQSVPVDLAQAYATTALARAKEAAHFTLALLVAILRAQLESLEASANPGETATSEAQAEDATYEMVSPVVPAAAGGSADASTSSISVPGAAEETSGLRARHVAGGVSSEN